MSDMAEGWDHDLGGVLSGRALREQPRYNGAIGMSDMAGKAATVRGRALREQPRYNSLQSINS